ncbi:MAG: hypothetical protein ACRDSL_13315 [Pseudonocardiaceae bacterium]
MIVRLIEGSQWVRTAVNRARSAVEMAVDPHAGLENLNDQRGPGLGRARLALRIREWHSVL